MDQMTIFYLHPCAKVSAEWLHDKMLTIMAKETQQLIATAIQLRFLESDERLPKATFHDHPWLDWAMESSDHMEWLLAYYAACVSKLETVFNRQDRGWLFQIAVRDWIPLFPRVGWRTVPLAVPYDCVADNMDIFTSYRNYYLRAKCRPGVYRRVRVPYWVRDYYDRPDESEESG